MQKGALAKDSGGRQISPEAWVAIFGLVSIVVLYTIGLGLGPGGRS